MRSERLEGYRTTSSLTVLEDTPIWDIDSLTFVRHDWGNMSDQSPMG